MRFVPTKTVEQQSCLMLHRARHLLIRQQTAVINSMRRESSGKWSIYSLRHFYAVTALRNGVGVFEVARNMGTSVQMVQEYYGRQAIASVFATRLGD